MRPVVVIGAAAMIGAAWYVLRQREQTESKDDTGEQFGVIAAGWDDVLTDSAESVAEFVDGITGGILKISTMSRVTAADLQNRNVQAVLRVIRAGEGTTDEAGYRRIFGGQLFTDYSDHPRITVKKSGYTSSAAGAYQFLISSWDETKRIMRLPDFSPRSQDLAAVGRIQARGALDDVKAGRFETAIKKIAREWASLPGSPYGQPTLTWQRAAQMYADAGGIDRPVVA
jgi:muramidase (phage lysozyme)